MIDYDVSRYVEEFCYKYPITSETVFEILEYTTPQALEAFGQLAQLGYSGDTLVCAARALYENNAAWPKTDGSLATPIADDHKRI